MEAERGRQWLLRWQASSANVAYEPINPASPICQVYEVNGLISRSTPEAPLYGFFFRARVRAHAGQAYTHKCRVSRLTARDNDLRVWGNQMLSRSGSKGVQAMMLCSSSSSFSAGSRNWSQRIR